MIEQVNSAQDMIQLLISTITLMGLIVLFHKRYIAPTLRKIDAGMELIQEQMKENGGGNLIDKVNKIPKIEEDLTMVKQKIESIEKVMKSDN